DRIQMHSILLTHAALLEVLDASASNLDPGMFRLLENGSGRGLVARICHDSDGNANERRQAGSFPIDGRPAVPAKIAADLAAARRCAGELFRVSRDDDRLSGIERTHPKRRAGSQLAFDTMAGNDQPG